VEKGEGTFLDPFIKLVKAEFSMCPVPQRPKPQARRPGHESRQLVPFDRKLPRATAGGDEGAPEPGRDRDQVVRLHSPLPACDAAPAVDTHQVREPEMDRQRKNDKQKPA